MRAVAGRGFTLLEVMVALAVIALAMSALLRTATTNSINAAYLRDRTLAHWVGMNEMTRLQLNDTWVPPGKRQGRDEMAGREWPWEQEVTATPAPVIRKVVIKVRGEDQGEEPLAVVVGYVAKP